MQKPELLVLMSGLSIGVFAGERTRVTLGVRIVLVLIAIFLCAREVAWGAICPVPTLAHPTITSALRDLGCDTVEVGAGTFAENLEIARDAVVQGLGPSLTVLEGYVRVTGVDNAVLLESLRVDGTVGGVAGCVDDLVDARDGGSVEAFTGVEVVYASTGGGACRIFSDGFESGGANAWSARVP